MQHVRRGLTGQRLGLGVELDTSLAHDVVETAITEHHDSSLDTRRQRLAALRAAHSSHLEHVGEVRAEEPSQRQVDRLEPEVTDRQPLVERAFPEQLTTVQVQRAARDVRSGFRLADVGVREVGREAGLFVEQRCREQQRTMAREDELELRDVPRPAVVDALLREPHGHDVAVAIHDRERLALLQRACAVVEPIVRRDDGVGLFAALGSAHADLPASPSSTSTRLRPINPSYTST